MIPVIFINCKEYPFVEWILSGTKQYETRNVNTLGRFIDERVLLAETGSGRPIVKGSAVISEVIEVYTANEWRAHITREDVPSGSTYDWNQDTRKKVLYKLTDIKRISPFIPEGPRHGRTWMECDNYPEKKEISNTERLETIGCFIDIFEDFLEDHGVDIPNEEKEQSEGPCIIYGTHYGELSDRIEHLLTCLNVL